MSDPLGSVEGIGETRSQKSTIEIIIFKCEGRGVLRITSNLCSRVCFDNPVKDRFYIHRFFTLYISGTL